MSTAGCRGSLRSWITGAAGLVAAAALGWIAVAALTSPSSDAGPVILTDHHGEAMTLADLEGRYPVVVFGYTYCPDVCPMSLNDVTQALEAFHDAAPQRARNVTPVFITVDPERDDPAAMRDYVSFFHPRTVGLTGSKQAIGRVADEFGVYYQKTKAPDMSDYLVDHTAIIFILGPDGEPIESFPYDIGIDRISAEMDKHVDYVDY